MSKHAAAAAGAPGVKRRIKPSTICFSEEPAPADDTGFRFAVSITCNVQRSLELRRSGQRADVLLQRYVGAGSGSAMTFPVSDLAALQSESACQATLRGMLADLPQLRSLHLADDEWDAVVPADIVPQLVRVATGDDARGGFTFCFTMKVHRRIIHGEQALLMACKDRELNMDGAKTADDCAICLDGLEGEPAVELAACNHAFHRRCICTWFSKATTYPMCRGDVRMCALPEFLGR